MLTRFPLRSNEVANLKSAPTLAQRQAGDEQKRSELKTALTISAYFCDNHAAQSGKWGRKGGKPLPKTTDLRGIVRSVVSHDLRQSLAQGSFRLPAQFAARFGRVETAKTHISRAFRFKLRL